MKKYYKHSLTAFVIGMILGIAVSFVSITVAYRVAVLIVAKIYKVSGGN